MNTRFLRLKASAKITNGNPVDELEMDLGELLENAIKKEADIGKDLIIIETQLERLNQTHHEKLVARKKVGQIIANIESIISGE